MTLVFTGRLLLALEEVYCFLPVVIGNLALAYSVLGWGVLGSEKNS